MSSSPSSSSSDSSVPVETPPVDETPLETPLADEPRPPPPTAAAGGVAPNAAVVAGLGDVLCPLAVEIGDGTFTVREVIELRRSKILRMTQAAGQDLRLVVNGVTLAQGEVVIVEDSTAVRVTEIADVVGGERETRA